jgi:hypothetical protein
MLIGKKMFFNFQKKMNDLILEKQNYFNFMQHIRLFFIANIVFQPIHILNIKYLYLNIDKYSKLNEIN